AEKNWEGCGGLTLTDEMRVAVAAHAALLVLAIPHDHYAGVRSILIYPSTYRSPLGLRDSLGVVHEGTALAGESWPGRGPVVLAWDQVRASIDSGGDGRNVV